MCNILLGILMASTLLQSNILPIITITPHLYYLLKFVSLYLYFLFNINFKMAIHNCQQYQECTKPMLMEMVTVIYRWVFLEEQNRNV